MRAIMAVANRPWHFGRRVVAQSSRNSARGAIPVRWSAKVISETYETDAGNPPPPGWKNQIPAESHVQRRVNMGFSWHQEGKRQDLVTM